MSLRIALMTDIHYADTNPRCNRFYRESIFKVREAVNVLRPRMPHVAVHLGDLIDGPQRRDSLAEIQNLRTIEAEFRRLAPFRSYVLGNHCLNTMAKGQYLATVGQRKSYFSYDMGGWHIVVLDGCFREDGAAYAPGQFTWNNSEVPEPQREWLEADLARTNRPTVVFCHQRLDMEGNAQMGVHSSQIVRQILRRSGKVKAVFMGHSHANELKVIDGIPYATLRAMVEGSGPTNSGYSLLTLRNNGTVFLEGFRGHAFHPLSRQPAA
ncbi:MAG: metallophosphoesterase [Armatimonas sp.]